MSDPPAELETADDETRPVRRLAPGMPRWVKSSLAILLALILVFAVATIAGLGGEHGPGRHGGREETPISDDRGDHVPPVDHRP